MPIPPSIIDRELLFLAHVLSNLLSSTVNIPDLFTTKKVKNILVSMIRCYSLKKVVHIDSRREQTRQKELKMIALSQ